MYSMALELSYGLVGSHIPLRKVGGESPLPWLLVFRAGVASGGDLFHAGDLPTLTGM